MTDDAADDDEDDERLLVLTASGERLRLDGGDRFDPHSADEDEEVDSLRVGLPMTPDDDEMSVESTRLLKGLSQLSLPTLALALAYMSKLLVVVAAVLDCDEPETCSRVAMASG